jgi:CheY-like chemotaxis protein
MPEMGGRDLAEVLRHEAPSLKILFTSGYANDEIVHHGALDHGASFLSKPFSAAELAGKVRKVLDA